MGIELSSNTGHTEKLGPTTGKQQVRERVKLMSSSYFFIAIQPWGVQFLKRCAKKGEDRQWFEPLWKKRVKDLEIKIPRNLHGVFKTDGGCKFKHGFE